MAISYVDVYHLMHSDGDLWRKAEVACFKAAGDILNESAGTANHANRVVWAHATLPDPAAAAAAMKYSILQNATIQAAGHTSTDNDVQYVVNSLIDSFATGA